jgi:hypothetical protein
VTLDNNKKFLLGSIFLINISENNYKDNNNFVIIFEADNIIRAYSILDLFVGLIFEYKKVITYFILFVLKIICVTAELKLDFLEEVF